MGLPLDEDAQMGAVVSQAQYDKVTGYVRIGLEEGAKLVAGGDRSDDVSWWATTSCPPFIRFARTCESPGKRLRSVVSILPWEDEQDVVRAMNDVDYGLSAGIWTNDLSRGVRVSRRSRPASCG